MKKFMVLFLFGCASAVDRLAPAEDIDCHPVEGDFEIICQDPVAQGLFSSATCYTEQELEQILVGRQQALESGVCEPKEYVVFPEPKIFPNEDPVILH